jgi:hypothetical protein
MAPKKNKKKGKTQVAEDDDWDALLQAEAVTNASEAPALVEDPREEEDNLESKEDKSPAVLDAAAAFLAASGAAPVDAGDSSGAKKKRKKKKKGAGAGGDVAAKDDSKVCEFDFVHRVMGHRKLVFISTGILLTASFLINNRFPPRVN